MKVCLIHNLWGNYARGGGERAIENIATGLRERGAEVFIITTRPWGAQTHTSEGLYELGSGYHSLERWPMVLRLLWHVFNLFNPFKYFQVKSIVQRERPDLVWSHNLTGFGFLLFSLFSRYRHIHTVHDIQLLHPSGLMLYGHENCTKTLAARIYQSLLRSLIPLKTMVIFPSQWIEKIHLEHNFFRANKRVVLSNPLNEKIVMPSAKASGVTSGAGNTKFLFVGQIEVHKGILLLLSAFGSLNNTVSLTVVGDGSLLESLRRDCAGKAIEFLGRQDKNQIRALMEKSDCLVVPSLCYENQPTVILEAISAGLAVIGSRIGGIPELIGDEGLFNPTEQGLTEKMQKVSDGRLTPNTSAPKILSIKEYIEAVLD